MLLKKMRGIYAAPEDAVNFWRPTPGAIHGGCGEFLGTNTRSNPQRSQKLL